MISRPAPQQSVRFGIFEVDVAAGQLLKRGQRVKLQEQPFQVLVLLLQRPGEIVTREDLQKAVWPADTFVEFDQGLNTAIKKIRQALGDSAESPRFIETIPRQGYRFIAPVDSATVPAPPPAPRRRGMFWAAAIAGALAVAGTAIWLTSPRKVQGVLPIPVPLTGHPGQEGSPSFSPDGNQVAFAWIAPGRDDFDIYIQLVGGDQPLRITKDPAHDYGCAWSPDGRWIAFLRGHHPAQGEVHPPCPVPASEPSDVLLIPALGGGERKLAEVYPPDTLGPFISWHPGGRWLIVSDRDPAAGPSALFLVSVDTGEKRRLTTPPRDSFGDADAAISPDGRAVVFDRTVGGTFITASDLHYLALAEDLRPKGEPKRITFGDLYTASPAWAPDGHSVLYSFGNYHDPSLCRIFVQGSGGPFGRPERLAFAGIGVRQPAISRRGRLLYTQHISDSDIWQLELSSGRNEHRPIRTAVKLISSTRIDNTPQYSADGKRIAFASNRSGSQEIWVCDSDGSNARKLTSFNGPYTANPSWSPDGQWITFGSLGDGRAAAYVVRSDGGAPRRLIDDRGEEAAAGWSHDGKWVYFSSNRTGQFQIWKASWNSAGRASNAVQVTQKGGLLASESRNGHFVYYLKTGDEISSLWRAPVEGGEETKVLDAVFDHNFAISDQGIYFIASGLRPSVQFLNFTTAKVMTIAEIPRMPTGGVAISPDGQRLLYTEFEGPYGELTLVENFGETAR